MPDTTHPIKFLTAGTLSVCPRCGLKEQQGMSDCIFCGRNLRFLRGSVYSTIIFSVALILVICLALLLCFMRPGIGSIDVMITLAVCLPIFILTVTTGLIATYVGYRSEVLTYEREQWEEKSKGLLGTVPYSTGPYGTGKLVLPKPDSSSPCKE